MDMRRTGTRPCSYRMSRHRRSTHLRLQASSAQPAGSCNTDSDHSPGHSPHPWCTHGQSGKWCHLLPQRESTCHPGRFPDKSSSCTAVPQGTRSHSANAPNAASTGRAQPRAPMRRTGSNNTDRRAAPPGKRREVRKPHRRSTRVFRTPEDLKDTAARSRSSSHLPKNARS